MDKNVELLNYIHQNSQMGQDTIKQLINVTKDENYKKMLQSQFNEYKMIYDETESKLNQQKKEAKDINFFSKASSYIMINLNTLVDKTPSHISEMLIRGSTMGIIDITKKMNEYSNANPEILGLANKLLLHEQNNVEECKKYLH